MRNIFQVNTTGLPSLSSLRGEVTGGKLRDSKPSDNGHRRLGAIVPGKTNKQGRNNKTRGLDVEPGVETALAGGGRVARVGSVARHRAAPADPRATAQRANPRSN